jgi:hypothetical protein
MRAVIVAFLAGVALVPMAVQAAPLAPRPPGPAIYAANQEWAPLPNGPAGNRSVEAARRSSWSLRVAAGAGTGTIGSTAGDIGIGDTAFPTGGDCRRYWESRRSQEARTLVARNRSLGVGRYRLDRRSRVL